MFTLFKSVVTLKTVKKKSSPPLFKKYVIYKKLLNKKAVLMGKLCD